MVDEEPLPPPKYERIGAYEVLRVYAATKRSTLYLCRDDRRNEYVAVKVFDPSREDRVPLDESGVERRRNRFLDEARILAGFDHPHIIPLKEQSELDDGTPYLVMPFIEHNLVDEMGRSETDPTVIKDLPERYRPKTLSPGRTVEILRQLLDALAAVHEKGIVHCDIKPINVLLTAKGGGAVRLCDFGLCKLPGRERSRTGRWAGTLKYLSPEQQDGVEDLDARSDVYSVGLLAYRMLVGRLPSGEFAPPGELRTDVPASLSVLVMEALDEDRENRPRDAGDMLARLNQILPPDTKTIIPAGPGFDRLLNGMRLYKQLLPTLPDLLGGKWGALSRFRLAFGFYRCFAAESAPAPAPALGDQKNNRELAHACLVLGQVLERRGKTKEAVAVCRHAVSLAPDWAQAHSELAHILAAHGETETIRS